MTKYAGHDVDLNVDMDGGTTYTTIAQIGDLSGPSISRNAIDVTTRDTTPAFWREFIKGFKDGGEITFTLMFDPSETTHGTTSGFLKDFEVDGTVIPAWQMAFPDGTNATFDGLLSSFDVSSPLDDALTADVTVKISGAVVWA